MMKYTTWNVQPGVIIIIESWHQIGEAINGEKNSDRTGYSVSLNNNGTIVAIGAPYNHGNGNNSGQVRVFKYDCNHS